MDGGEYIWKYISGVFNAGSNIVIDNFKSIGKIAKAVFEAIYSKGAGQKTSR